MKITKQQLRKVIKEALWQGPGPASLFVPSPGTARTGRTGRKVSPESAFYELQNLARQFGRDWEADDKDVTLGDAAFDLAANVMAQSDPDVVSAARRYLSSVGGGDLQDTLADDVYAGADY